MNTRVLAMVLLVLGTIGAGCLGRAPTTYELDRRAGFKVPVDDAAPDKTLTQLDTSSAVAPAPRVPVKLPSVIEKVWVSDLGLSEDARLQGTWMFVEVERGRWLDEVDPGGAPLLGPASRAPALGSARPAKGSTPAAEAAALKLRIDTQPEQ